METDHHMGAIYCVFKQKRLLSEPVREGKKSQALGLVKTLCENYTQNLESENERSSLYAVLDNYN